jgi:NAD(P)-dependent dehydrogenase (short-subunit alcohol dehydrogenase family)
MKNINYKEKFNLKNKTAFVIGGSGLIGKEVVYALADFGAKVIILDIKNNSKFLKNYNKIFFEHFDVTQLNQNENSLKKIIKKHTTPDIFINCSYPHDKNWSHSSFSEIKLKSIIENVNIHMNSYIWIARIIAENMKKNKIHGSIIQLGSTYGVVGQNLSIYKNTKIKENLTYSAIKGGITNNAKLMASYYGKFNIRVNCVCPGGLLGHVAGNSKTQPATFKKRYNENVPLKRMGKPDEVASAILFLSTEAASYITGSTFMVDGGWTSI